MGDSFERTGKMLMRLTIGAAELTWAESYTKLLAFNQTQYERVLVLDSDATLLKVSSSTSHFWTRLSTY